MLRLHPAFYLAATLLGIALAYWGIEAVIVGTEEGRAALGFWIVVDILLTIIAAALGIMGYVNRPITGGRRDLTTFRASHVPRPAAGVGQLGRAATDWSRHGEVPRGVSGRDPLGRRNDGS